MKRTEFIEELEAFVRDMQELCDECKNCYDCILWSAEDSCLANFYQHFNVGKVMDAVENYRNRNALCAEVIDKARDIYIYELQIDRSGTVLNNDIAQKGPAAAARYRADEIERYYGENICSVKVLSAKRFVLESHREDAE